MGRFFETAPTQFVENYIYQPPWELMQQAAAQKQKIYDAAIASTKLFDNIPIEHLQGEDDVYNVQEKQRYYAESAANIAKAIQNDPSKAQQYLNNIDSLQKELQKDMTSGDLSKIIGSAQAYKKWQEDNKKLKEDDASRYTAAERAYLGEYLNAGGNSLSQGFRGEQVTKGIDYDAIRKSLGELKANKIKSTKQTPGGGLYMVETENGLEEMSEERMNGWMLSQILSPENLASLSQSEKFGLGTYRNSEGKIDYDNGSLFAPLRGFARAGHYSQQENSFKMSADSAAIAQLNEAGQNRRYYAGLNWEKTKFEIQRTDDAAKAAGADKATRKAPLEAAMAKALIDGDQKAVAIYQAQIDAIDGKQSLTQTNLGSKYADTNALIQASKSGDKIAQKHIDQTLPQALKEAGINYKDPKQKALAQKIVGMVKQGKLDLNDIPTYIASKNDVNILYQVKSTDIQAEALKMAKERGVKDPTPFYSLAKQKLVLKQTLKDKNSKYGLSSEAAKNIITDGIEKWQTNFANNRGFSSIYEVTGFKPSSQASLASTLNNHEFGKEFSIEIRNKDGKPDIVDYDKSNVKIVAIKGITDKRGNGTNMYVGIDDKGREYNIIANNENPLTRQFANVAFAGIENKSASVALSLQYPTVGRLRAAIEGSKRLNTKDLNFDITIGNKNYRIKVDTNNNVQAYDEYAKPVFSLPKDYIEAGIALENLNK